MKQYTQNNWLKHAQAFFDKAWEQTKHWFGRTFGDDDDTIFSNARASTGTHVNTLTKRSGEAAIPTGRLVTFEGKGERVKLCDTKNVPFGVSTDTVDAFDAPINVALLGVSNETVRIQTSKSIALGQFAAIAESGQIQPLNKETPGLYWIVGIALSDGQKDDLVEVASTVPFTIEIK